jgi:hypothetical protein
MSAKKAFSLFAILCILSLVGSTSDTAKAASPLYGAFLISDQASDISPSSVAYNSQAHNYLVVWCHQQAGSIGVFARTISETGQLGPVYPVSDTTADADRCYPDVAYNSIHNNYLVVWQQQSGADFTVHGRLFFPSSYLGSDINFSDQASNSTTPPAVDYSYSSDEFLVVWAYWTTSVNSSIHSQLINATGLKLGSNLTIFSGHDSLSAYDPDIAYNIARNEYLIVYTRLDTAAPGGPNKDIFGWRVTHDVIKLGSELEIAYFTPQELQPSVAAVSTDAPESGRYLVAYQITYSTGDSDVWGQLVLGDGSIEGSTIEIQSTGAYETNPAIVGSLSSHGFMVAWTDTYPPDYIFSSILARSVNQNGTMLAAYWLGGFFADNSSVAAGSGGNFLSTADDVSLFGNRDLYGSLLGNRIYLPMLRKP